jgi:hypothetical protein
MSSHSAAGSGKDVIYVDVDDEITGIIDKVRASKQKIVALVLPKRATVLQSIVNMKLLKRAGDESKKNLVLITSEGGLLPLAGAVGVHVARTLQSRPEVPDAPARDDDRAVAVDEPADDGTAFDEPSADRAKTVGELAGAAAVDNQLDDTIELDDEDAASDEPEGSAAGAGIAAAKTKKGKNKKLRVPDFNKFRMLLLFGGVGLIALIVVSYIAFAVMPAAKITIKTDSQAITSSLVLNLKTAAGTLADPASSTIPATAQTEQKTLSQQVAATGQQNNGEKASGSVTLSLTDCSKDMVTIPAGYGISSGGRTFITGSAATLQSVKIGGTCKNSSFPSVSTQTISVTAQSAGASYNVAAGTFTVPGYSNVTGSSGAPMSGGTDDIVKFVTQADIDSATQKIGAQDADAVKQDLKSGLIAKSLYSLDATFTPGNPETTTSVKAGDVADSVTVTQKITYSMLGVQQDDLKNLVQRDVAGKIDTKRQSILDYGLSNATFNVQSQNPDGATVGVQTTVVAGPDLKVDPLKKQVAGKKASEATNIIKSNPGVTDVDVSYSPFWVSSIPKKTSKITITIQKPSVTTDAKSKP